MNHKMVSVRADILGAMFITTTSILALAVEKKQDPKSIERGGKAVEKLFDLNVMFFERMSDDDLEVITLAAQDVIKNHKNKDSA